MSGQTLHTVFPLAVGSVMRAAPRAGDEGLAHGDRRADCGGEILLLGVMPVTAKE